MKPISKKKFERLHFLATKCRKSTLKRDGREDFEYLQLWRQFAESPCPELAESELAPLTEKEVDDIWGCIREMAWGCRLTKKRKAFLIKRIGALKAFVLKQIEKNK